MITLDTSGLVAVFIKRDQHHHSAIKAIKAGSGPLIIPIAILCEVTYMLQRTLGSSSVLTVLNDIAKGAFSLGLGERDLPRVMALVETFADLPLGFADASVVACAERRGERVLTYDMKHFFTVARSCPIEIVN